MNNIDMDSIVEYAIEKVKAEILGMRGSKVKAIDIDDISYNDNSISFQVIGYNAAAKAISEDYFTCSINFEDAPAESEDDVKWLIDNNVPEFAYNFVKNPVRPILHEEATYNVQFYQIFSNPEKPTDNGKMIAQAGTEDEAKEKGDELVGKGNYLIKAVCDDGKVRDVDLYSYFNESAESGFNVGDRVKQKWANPYNVGEVIDTKYTPEEGNMIQVKWDYSDGPDVEWLNIDEVSSYNEDDERAGYYESLDGMNTYNVTFYMDSLDDNVMSGPSTTKKIYAASKEEAEKKLRAECTDKYYIPTITDVELVENIVMEELKPGDRVYVTVSNRQGNVIKMVSDDVVEVELDGGLYPARIDRFYVDEVKLLDMQPEVDDEIDYDDIDPDAVVDSLKEELTADEVRSRVSNYLKSHEYSLTDTMDEEDICAEICDNLFDMNYNTMTSDLSHAVFTEVTNYFEEDLEEDLGHTIGTALFCTASIEVCTIGGVDEDGEDVDEPVIFDDKTPVNTILTAIDPDTDAGNAKCAEINQLLNAMPDGYIQVQAYCRGRDMGDRQVYDAYELYDELRDIFNLDESLHESNNAYTYRGHYIINDGGTWMIKDGNNVVRSGIATDSEAEEIIDDLNESVDYEDSFVADDDM